MKKMLTMMLLLMCAVSMNAQKSKVSDKEIIGTWMMKSMQWEGEKVIECDKEKGYTQFKYYGPDGEYACAEIVLKKDGQLVIYPHEYGTYTFKNGVYSEMGRPSIEGNLVFVDKNTFKGTWFTRHDVWKKVALPDKVVKQIVSSCKTKDTPDDVQQLIKKHIFK